MKRKNQNGFTLIEVTIYIALFSVLIGSAFVIAYQLINGSKELGAESTAHEEVNFVLRKFNWALTGISDITSPTPSSLVVTKYGGNKVYIQLKETKIEIRESNTTFLPITTDNAKVIDLNFEVIFSTGSGATGVKVTTTINDTEFSITKYIRQ